MEIYEFKFRAECLSDIILFLNTSRNFLKFNIDNDEATLPDCEIEITTYLNYSSMLGIMRRIPDSHVMMQTLQPKLDYTGIRNHDIK